MIQLYSRSHMRVSRRQMRRNRQTIFFFVCITLAMFAFTILMARKDFP